MIFMHHLLNPNAYATRWMLRQIAVFQRYLICVLVELMTLLDLLKELGDSALCVKVTRFPVQQCGTGLSIPDEYLIVKPLDTLKLRCPGFGLIYHHEDRYQN